jgi:antitoxin component YwqK of YwqJK toxin-antitoxin module
MTLTKQFFLATLLFFQISNCFSQKINQLDENGKRHGVWKKNHEKTNFIRYRGQFNHGKETGLFEYFDKNERNYPYATKLFDEQTGIAETKFFLPENGALVSQGKMKDTLKIGEWVYFHKNSKDTLMVEFYQNGLLEGEKKIYYPKGIIAEISHFKNGKQEGLAQTFEESSGLLLSEIEYRDDLMHGKAVYYEDGKIIVEGNNRDGNKVGEWRYYENGELQRTKKF